MNGSDSLLPVIYNDTHKETSPEGAITPELSPEEVIPKVKKENEGRRKRSGGSGFLFYITSISLSLLALFSLFLCIFASSDSILSADKIIGYIASDFLGIDISSGNKNIYELLMSGSFGEIGTNDPTEPTDKNEPSTQKPTTDPDNNFQSQPPSSDNKAEIVLPTPPSESEIPEGEYAIIATDLSKDKITLSNQTNYNIDISEYLNKEATNDGYTLTINDDMTIDPVVLIIHTHGTEAFSAEGSISYSETTNLPRSEDITKNIVAVGAEMARTLNEIGIPTLHCTIMHDKDSYKNSYDRAEETIKEYLRRYPSIQYVFDVHRDSIVSESKIKYKPLTIIDGEATAQVMLVMGSNESTHSHENWQSNLTLAIKLTSKLNESYPHFTRTLSLRSSSYNQEYTKGSLLIEIGSCGNTLQEAKRAGILTAKELGEMIKTGW